MIANVFVWILNYILLNDLYLAGVSRSRILPNGHTNHLCADSIMWGPHQTVRVTIQVWLDRSSGEA